MADIAQIQIVPVDNGFFVQVINSDGSGTKNPRLAALNRADLVKEIKKLAEELYTKEPAKPTTLVPPPASTPPPSTPET